LDTLSRELQQSRVDFASLHCTTDSLQAANQRLEGIHSEQKQFIEDLTQQLEAAMTAKKK